tara:strand:+ start:1514 stop:1843 length:330 start_codon:yes stop_codon:yes gene_type:complete
MDIFTTQLTRVVPVPIKPASLKVKALLKDAASTKLKEDHDHLENHEYYFEHGGKKEDEYHHDPQENKEQAGNLSEKDEPLLTKPTNEQVGDKSDKKETLDKDKHLDLYA